MKRIIRVFPRRTKATPTDELAAINRSPELFDQADEIHISVAFSYDLPRAEQLAKEWKYVAPPPNRRTSNRPTQRGLHARHVHKAGIYHHIARMPQPLLVLQCVEEGR